MEVHAFIASAEVPYTLPYSVGILASMLKANLFGYSVSVFQVRVLRKDLRGSFLSASHLQYPFSIEVRRAHHASSGFAFYQASCPKINWVSVPSSMARNAP